MSRASLSLVSIYSNAEVAYGWGSQFKKWHQFSDAFKAIERLDKAVIEHDHLFNQSQARKLKEDLTALP